MVLLSSYTHTDTSLDTLSLIRTNLSRQHWKKNICSIPALWIWSSSSLRQQGMRGKPPKFPPGWLWLIAPSGLATVEYHNTTTARNYVLQLFSPFVLTMQSMRRVADGAQITDLMPMGSSVRDFLWRNGLPFQDSMVMCVQYLFKSYLSLKKHQ